MASKFPIIEVKAKPNSKKKAVAVGLGATLLAVAVGLITTDAIGAALIAIAGVSCLYAERAGYLG
jgi:hypothetical protein